MMLAVNGGQVAVNRWELMGTIPTHIGTYFGRFEHPSLSTPPTAHAK
jgi:hypothetical protein